MKAFVETEKGIQTAIINYLAYKGYYVQRMNSGAIRTAKGGMVKLAAKGTPDIMAFRPLVISRCSNGGLCSKIKLVFIEVKRPGNKPTFAQEQTMQLLTEHGARCIVATCVEDVEKAL